MEFSEATRPGILPLSVRDCFFNAAAANDVCELRRMLSRSSAAVATSREG
jgi:hypothetical protein